jgi:hypothetical protein
MPGKAEEASSHRQEVREVVLQEGGVQRVRVHEAVLVPLTTLLTHNRHEVVKEKLEWGDENLGIVD